MKIFLLTVLALSGTFCSRIRRQDDGDFWWLNPDNLASTDGTTSAPASVHVSNEDTKSHQGGSGNTGNVGSNNQPCVCVPFYQCDDDENLITDGSGLIDIRTTAQCPGDIDFCCKNPNTAITPVTPTPKVTQCGKRNENGVLVRILNNDYSQGNSAQFGEFPWMAAVLRKEKVDDTKSVNLYVCGGSLIAPNVVLTAAHCVERYASAHYDLVVRLGEWNTQDTNEPYLHEDRSVIRIAVHPTFNPRSLKDDFALLFLDQDAILSDHVNTVCLPDINTNLNAYGSDCIATGWGKDNFGAEGSYQNVLKKVELPLVNTNDCQQYLRTTRLGEYFVLDPSFICAGGRAGVDTCKGDGGSPLVCPVYDSATNLITSYQQVGIVAWGIGCGENGIPGVYANIKYAIDWINWEAYGQGSNPYGK